VRGGAFRLARVAFRLPVLVSGTLILTLTWFALLPATLGSPGRRRRLRGFVFGSWSRLCLAGLAIETEVAGAPPAGPCFLVANHLGYVDIWVLSALRNCVFVSMAEVRRWPLIGTMARFFGTIFLERADKRSIPLVNREIARALADGHTVVLFPEGTGSRGAHVAPFRPSLLEPALQSGARIVWAALRYETSAGDPPASRSVAWVETHFAIHLLRALQNRGVRARVVFGEAVTGATDRKTLARELHARVSDAFEPMR
jgi:1-acyl-sn-glycerol-3-phosphate acyltransferase